MSGKTLESGEIAPISTGAPYPVNSEPIVPPPTAFVFPVASVWIVSTFPDGLIPPVSTGGSVGAAPIAFGPHTMLLPPDGRHPDAQITVAFKFPAVGCNTYCALVVLEPRIATVAG